MLAANPCATSNELNSIIEKRIARLVWNGSALSVDKTDTGNRGLSKIGWKYQGWVICRDQNFDDKGEGIGMSFSIKLVALLRQPAAVLAMNS
jgi:hypothetical protein